jgi:hypothetical protein
MVEKMPFSGEKMTGSHLSTGPAPDKTTSEASTERHAEQVSEGGLQAWATVAGGLLVYMAGLG